MSAKRIKKFRVYIVTDKPEEKHWQEIRSDDEIMNYRALFDPNERVWNLYSKLGARRSETEVGDHMRTFSELQSLCGFLGVNNLT